MSVNSPGKPSALACWLLAKMIDNNVLYSAVGDVEEGYNNVYNKYGRFAAYCWFWIQVILCLPKYAKNSTYWSMIMIKNYLKIAIRNIKRYRGYSFINIMGLAIGLTCTILIMLYIKYEFSYDQYHENKEYIYRVVMYQKGNMYRGTEWFNATPGALKPIVNDAIPEVLRSSRAKQESGIIIHDENIYRESDIRYVDSEFLEMFTYPLIIGDPQTALIEPFSLILTASMAEKYFHDADPMGKILKIGSRDFKITGVMKDVPENSHFTFDFLASFNSLYTTWGGREHVERWNSNNTWGMYILVSNGIDRYDLEKKLSELRKNHIETDSDYKDESIFKLQKLTEIHLHSRLNFDEANISDIRYIYLFSAIAFLIMMIACLNYMNLATARSVKRSKEVGIRKVVGAFRINLIKQFFGESILFVLFSLVISICTVYAVIPVFSSFIDRGIDFSMLNSPNMYLGILGTLVFVGIVSGSYPALYLSAFKPINIVRGIIKNGAGRSIGFRNSLVVIQFMISVILIVCSLVVYSQLEYIRKKNLGFNKEHIIYGITSGTIRKNFQPFKEELEKNPDIIDIYSLGDLPVTVGSNSYPKWEGKQEGEDFLCYNALVDYNFIEFFDCHLSAGRTFSPELTTDVEEAWLLNETAVKMIGWDDPIGKKFGFNWRNPNGKVIGVFKDFHNTSLHIEVEPMALCLVMPDTPRRIRPYYAVKIGNERINETLDYLEQKFKAHSPDYPFRYFFLDERVDNMYRSEQKLGEIFNYFTAIAIFISCLGLFGLVSFTAEQKTKEIGIRKVLGADIGSVVRLISREFLMLIIIANLISWPIAWYAMDKWLQNFAYHTNMEISLFLVSGGLVVLVAILTISYQSIKAALSDPVNSLRYE